MKYNKSAPTTPAEDEATQQARDRSRSPTGKQAAAAAQQQMTDADELWKATLENQRSRTEMARPEASTSSSSRPTLKSWSRIDLGAKRYRGSNSKGPLWGDVVRRITMDLDMMQIIKDEVITPEISVHKLHDKLPEGVENIETILVYQPQPGNPDPGELFDGNYPKGAIPPPDKVPEEDARLIDLGLKRGLDDPMPSDRRPNRTKIFGQWRADDITEYGDKGNFPVIAGSRDINAFPRLKQSDCLYVTKRDKPSTDFLTKQSGKET